MRVIAGFNIMVLAGLVSLARARVLDGILPVAWRLALGSSVFLIAWATLFLAAQQTLTRVGPLVLRPG
ncbi:MAG: hypothetical protein M3010_08715 [Candidatus Dormibacteraeota bacterium]|nr:hypothetical protein [Candidatus Dormibacteraeota bacterium]